METVTTGSEALPEVASIPVPDAQAIAEEPATPAVIPSEESSSASVSRTSTRFHRQRQKSVLLAFRDAGSRSGGSDLMLLRPQPCQSCRAPARSRSASERRKSWPHCETLIRVLKRESCRNRSFKWIRAQRTRRIPPTRDGSLKSQRFVVDRSNHLAQSEMASAQ